MICFLFITQTRPRHLEAWGAHSISFTACFRVPRVSNVERTVGIEIHDIDVQGKRVMVLDHEGQLFDEECSSAVLWFIKQQTSCVVVHDLIREATERLDRLVGGEASCKQLSPDYRVSS
jgi:hypothetical protein